MCANETLCNVEAPSTLRRRCTDFVDDASSEFYSAALAQNVAGRRFQGCGGGRLSHRAEVAPASAGKLSRSGASARHLDVENNWPSLPGGGRRRAAPSRRNSGLGRGHGCVSGLLCYYCSLPTTADCYVLGDYAFLTGWARISTTTALLPSSQGVSKKDSDVIRQALSSGWYFSDARYESRRPVWSIQTRWIP